MIVKSCAVSPENRATPSGGTTSPVSFHHDAFLSDSHSADGRLAPALEAALEKLARPLFRLRAIDVFRDQTSLAANPGLRENQYRTPNRR